MKLWVLDSNLLFKMVEGTDPALQPALESLAHEAGNANADFAISAVTVHEFLVRPHQLGVDQWHEARAKLDPFIILQFDRAAAEEAAKLERARAAYISGASTKSEGKRVWFRDAAIVGTAIARGAELVLTHDGDIANMKAAGVAVRRI